MNDKQQPVSEGLAAEPSRKKEAQREGLKKIKTLLSVKRKTMRKKASE